MDALELLKYEDMTIVMDPLKVKTMTVFMDAL